MKKSDFENAVFSKEGPSWPFLDDCRFGTKKRSKTTQTSSNEKDEINVCLSASSERKEHIQSASNVKSQCNDLIENNFPELSKTIMMKKCFQRLRCTGNGGSHQVDNEGMRNRVQSNFATRKNRIPKFRNEISISLSSLIKTSIVKNKLPNKKLSIQTRMLCGNKLDGDRPARNKGKSRLIKKKYLTKYKKDVILSKSLRKKHIYNHDFHKAKCLLPSMIKCSDDLNIKNIETLLGSLHIEEPKGIENNIAENNPESNNQSSEISSKEVVSTLLHSRKFRKYCDNVVTVSLLKNLENLIVRLRNLQDKQHARDPSKTLAKRRYLCGFRETKRFILCDSVKAVITATDLDIDPDLPSGRLLNEIKELTEERSIPLIFGGKSRQLSYWTLKKQKISIISILRYEGAEQLYNDCIISWQEGSLKYKNIIEKIETHLPLNIASGKDILQDVEQEIRDNILFKLSSGIT